jgi:Ca-activated chloride channel family protein
MILGNPFALILLLGVGALAALDFIRQSNVAARWPRVARLWAGHHAIDLSKPVAAPRTRWFFWSGLALVVVALAEPRYGQAEVAIDQQPPEIVVALDLSRSMMARDVKPSRLDHAKLLLEGFFDKLAGEHVGLVLFADSAYIQLPLSPDYEILTGFLPSLSTSYFPQSGTNFEAMLRTSLEAYSQLEGVERYLLVISDGEAFDSQWVGAISALKDKGVRVIALSIGTAAGAVMPTENNSVVKDRSGNEVLSRVNPATLQRLAKDTGGVYLNANSWVNLADVLKNLRASQPKGQIIHKKDETKLVDRFRWPLVPAVLLLFLSFWRELPVRPRNRAMKNTESLSSAARTAATVSALVLLSGLLAASSARAQDDMQSTDKAEVEGKQLYDLDHPSPMMEEGQMISGLINGMLTRTRPIASDDLVSLAGHITSFCEDMLKARQRFPITVIDDGMRALDLGQKLDPQGGDWDMMRNEFRELAKADLAPWNTTLPDAAGKSDVATGFDPKNDMKVDETRGGTGIASDPVIQQRLDEIKKKFAAHSAFGDMGALKKTSAKANDMPSLPSDTQVIGGKKTAEEEERDEHPELILPLQRLDYVRSQDLPAKLFEMLDGNKTYLVSQGSNW